MRVETTIQREVEFGIEAEIDYRASQNRITREVRVKTDSGGYHPNWERTSRERIDAGDVPKDVLETLLARAKEKRDERVSDARDIRENLLGAE